MMIFLLTFAISFLFLAATALLINFCKKKQNRTNHGLTGMCHESGGQMCSSCSSRMQLLQSDGNRPPKEQQPDRQLRRSSP
ncbi:hypothetical protein [Desulforhopalus singaporensis]|uniref:Uncharacterized protein n=1 Tax=Desulforhopalus singaporensis TaxID=91360 RepID=A0A1H0SYG1_9BACT|nr:hypothetical protein [Desulforhopalus singaporensis]SDP46600.1 hypothetical protein SAMN05660330_02853 [Desulforhopalus singaporensis]